MLPLAQLAGPNQTVMRDSRPEKLAALRVRMNETREALQDAVAQAAGGAGNDVELTRKARAYAHMLRLYRWLVLSDIK